MYKFSLYYQSGEVLLLIFTVCEIPWNKVLRFVLVWLNHTLQVSWSESPGLLFLPDLHGQKGQGRSSHNPAALGVVLHQWRPEVCGGDISVF